jgi:beta-phosphoglucomutase family hydrolase
MDINALIFDCDGTLVDNMPLHYRAWQRVARRHGFCFPEHRFYSLGGVPAREIAEALKREQALSLDPAGVAHEKEEEYLALITHAQPMAHVLEVVRSHHGRMPMAVASCGTHRATHGVLGHLNIREYFDAVVTSEEVARHKPAPDVFLEAARRIGVDPRRCRAYEDTDLGLRAIRAAGMQPVDVRALRRSARGAQAPSFGIGSAQPVQKTLAE